MLSRGAVLLAAGIAAALAPVPAVAPGPACAAAAESPAAPDDDPAAAAIRFYQRYLSSQRHVHCRFSPSCSEYALEAFRAFGLVEGSARAADRLMRCNASAAGFYARGADGRLLDPVTGPTPAAVDLRVPGWMLPPVPEDPPASSSLHDTSRAAPWLESLSFARALEARGDCYRAATEYQRAAHQTGAPAMDSWAFARIGACFYRGADWENAHTAFLTSAMLAAPREDLPRLAVLAAACRFNLGEFSAAERAIVEGAPPDSSWSTLALLGMCAAARGDWSAAQARLAISQRKSPGPGPARSLARLGEAAAAGSELPHRAPRLAMALSAIVPGGGQVYAGHAADGVRHLLFNAALIATVVQFAADGKPGAAYVTASVAAPFYLGNVLGARAAARQFNRDRRLAHLARAAARAETGLEQARRP